MKLNKLYREPLGFVNSGEPQSGSDLNDHEKIDIASISTTNDRSKMDCYDGPPNSLNLTVRGITLRSLPGIQRSFELGDLSPGLNVIIGPNASGKTSICQAVRRLLWPHAVKHLLHAEIHSEWSDGQACFTIEVKDGQIDPHVSQSGKQCVQRLPEEALLFCFSMTIDELFDGKDEEFAQRIAREIAGGYDLASALKSLTPEISLRPILKEWEAAGVRFKQHKQSQEIVRQEGSQLPGLERLIREAEEANGHVLALEKILMLKNLKNQIAISEKNLQTFPKQLIECKIRATDWANYQQLGERCDALRKKIGTLETQQILLEGSVGRWREVVLSAEELDRQMDVIQAMQRLEIEQKRVQSKIDDLESDLKEHRRLLGIFSTEEIEKIDVSHLDDLEIHWERLDRWNSKIEGLQTQIHLNEMELSSVPPSAKNFLSSATIWIITAITCVISGLLVFLLSDWMKLCALSVLIPLGFLWMGVGQSAKQLNQTVLDSKTSLLKRKRELEQLLELEKRQQQELQEYLVQKASEAGIAQLPMMRYRFASDIKELHKDWKELKKYRLEQIRIEKELANQWSDWNRFAALFGEGGSDGLLTMHHRIKNKMGDIHHMKKIETEMIQERKSLNDLEDKIAQLLTKTESLACPEHLERLVEQLPHYQQMEHNLNHLRRQFDEAAFEDLNVFRIDESREILESEKKAEEEKAKTLTELSEKKGSVKARIQEMETAAQGEELLRAQEEKLAILRQTCRDVARKELLQSLVFEVQREFQRDCQPPVLEQSAEWFCRFTKNKFRLEAPSTQTGTIVYEVVDTSTGERKTLDQLSRGTRMQLLLSVRLAFSLHGKDNTVFPPIFLDEVLANTDPERFDAVAEVVSELTASGKQIFYLTCNPEDAWKWKARCPNANLIDLAKIRGEQAFLAAPLPMIRETIPKPSGQHFSLFVQELKLPALRMDEPLEMVSIHYLVDRVDDLHRLLKGGIETYGNLMYVREDLLERGFPESVGLIKRRGQLLERFFDLSMRGRGKPISRNVLLEGGLSKIFIDRIWEISQELDCNAKKLIELLEDKSKKDERKKGFRTEDREGLKGYLLQHGYLDERPLLKEAEIRCELLPLTIEEQDRLFMEQLFI